VGQRGRWIGSSSGSGLVLGMPKINAVQKPLSVRYLTQEDTEIGRSSATILSLW